MLISRLGRINEANNVGNKLIAINLHLNRAAEVKFLDFLGTSVMYNHV